MYQRKNGDGTLWTNGYKQKDTHPDMRGDFLGLDGVEYEIAGWKKAKQDGTPYLSLKVSPKRSKPDDRRPERGSHSEKFHENTPANDLNDEIPF